MHIYAFTYMHIYAYVYMHIYAYMHTHAHTYTHTVSEGGQGSGNVLRGPRVGATCHSARSQKVR